MIEAGAFAFLPRGSVVFRDFLSRHGLSEAACPLQSQARNGRWQIIRLGHEVARQQVS